MADIGSTISTELGSLSEQRQTLLEKQAAGTSERERTHAEGAQREQQETAELSRRENQPLPERPTVDMPPPPDIKKLVQARDYEGLSQGLLAMALVGGVVSQGDWLGVSKTLNGALQGFHEGNQELAEREMKEYKTKFDAARQKAESVNKQYQDVLENRRLSINEQREKVKLIAVQNGHTDVYTAANMNSIDKMVSQIDARITQLTGVQQRHEDMQDKMNMQLKIHNLTGGAQLSPRAEQFVATALKGGDPSWANMIKSRYGLKAVGPVIEDLASQGINPLEITANRASQLAETSALRMATNRKNAVERLTSSVQTIEERVFDLTKKLNGMGLQGVNATVNAVKRQLGDAELAELRTLTASVGRQYVEAVTMPGSNAQMHVAAQEWSTGMLNENLPLSSLAGTLRGMNLEIDATHKALQKQIDEGTRHMASMGAPAPQAATAKAPAAPYSDPDKERRYQEWKASHGAQ